MPADKSQIASGQLLSLPRIIASLCVLLSLAALAVPPLLLYYSDNLLHDTAHMVYNSRELVAGRVPYRDFFNHHFVGYILPLAVMEMLIGLDSFGVALMSFLAQLLYVLAVTWAASLHGAKGKQLIFALFLAATIGWFPSWQGTLLNCQSIFLPLVVILYCLAIKLSQNPIPRTIVLAGFVLGLCVICDQRLLMFSLLILTGLILSQSFTFRSCLLCAAGFLLPTLTCLGTLWWLGAIPDFIEQTIFFPLLHRSSGVETHIIVILLRLLRHALLEPLFLYSIIFVLLITSGYLSISRNNFWLLSMCLLSGVLYALLGTRPFPNYLLMLAPALITGAILATSPLFFSKNLKNVFLSLATVGFCIVCARAGFAVVAKIHMGPGTSTHRIADYIKSHSTEDSRLLVWGYCPQIYVFSDRLSGFRDIGLMTLWQQAPYTAEFLAMMHNEPPLFVVSTLNDDSKPWKTETACFFNLNTVAERELVTFMQEQLREKYVLEKTFRDGDHNLGIFRLNTQSVK